MTKRMTIPPNASLNAELTAMAGREVILFESVPIAKGERIEIRFISHAGPRKQGVWIGVEGKLEVAGQELSQITLWQDTAPPVVPLRILETKDGRLRFYNVFDGGHGRRSQGRFSGLLREQDGPKTTYRCNDDEPGPVFDRLVFELVREPSISR